MVGRYSIKSWKIPSLKAIVPWIYVFLKFCIICFMGVIDIISVICWRFLNNHLWDWLFGISWPPRRSCSNGAKNHDSSRNGYYALTSELSAKDARSSCFLSFFTLLIFSLIVVWLILLDLRWLQRLSIDALCPYHSIHHKLPNFSSVTQADVNPQAVHMSHSWSSPTPHSMFWLPKQ